MCPESPYPWALTCHLLKLVIVPVDGGGQVFRQDGHRSGYRIPHSLCSLNILAQVSACNNNLELVLLGSCCACASSQNMTYSSRLVMCGVATSTGTNSGSCSLRRLIGCMMLLTLSIPRCHHHSLQPPSQVWVDSQRARKEQREECSGRNSLSPLKAKRQQTDMQTDHSCQVKKEKEENFCLRFNRNKKKIKIEGRIRRDVKGTSGKK